MLYNFFVMQWFNPSPGDWTEQVKNDMRDLEIRLDLEEIETYSADEFKSLVKKKVDKFTFKELVDAKNKHRKMETLEYKEFKTQNYITLEEMKPETVKEIFKFRVKMADFKYNFKGKYKEDLRCPLCRNHIDKQDEIVNCSVLKNTFNNLHEVERV